MKLKQEHEWLKNHIRSELIEVESDMTVMKWALEDIYSDRFNECKEYYTDNVDLLYKSFHDCIDELSNMEEEYKESEEYEKCQVITEVKNNLKKKFIPGFK